MYDVDYTSNVLSECITVGSILSEVGGALMSRGWETEALQISRRCCMLQEPLLQGRKSNVLGPRYTKVSTVSCFAFSLRTDTIATLSCIKQIYHFHCENSPVCVGVTNRLFILIPLSAFPSSFSRVL